MTMAKAKGIGADLSGWNAMTWARHWKQRVGVELARGRARLIRAQMTIVESGEADDQGTTQEFDPAVGAGPPTETNAEEGCDLNAQESEEVEEQERGDEEGGRGEGAGAGEAGKEAANDQR